MDIRILPSNIANMIAAGEVVQRPASVVKELMENAVDAGADSVTVALQDAGRTLIQVIDNGCGMSPDQAVLCFERHATSKIASVEDLNDITTFGFRGEALASIAAVAEVSLKTRREEDEVGCEVIFADSQHVSTEEVSTPRGANFSVRNLFYNVPARRKFLKSDNVELKHITAEFIHVALTRPEVAFTLSHNGKDLFVLKKAKSLKFRIQALLGASAAERVVDINIETSVAKISGFVGSPETAKKALGNQYFFVNGRFFKSPYFHKAILKAYEGMIPEGVTPSYFIYMEVDPHAMDVNIHPTKTEIKFEDDAVIFQTLYASVKEALGRNSFGGAIDFEREGMTEMPVFSKNFEEFYQVSEPKMSNDPTFNPFDHDGYPEDDYKTQSSSQQSFLSTPQTYHTQQYLSQKQDYGKLFEDNTMAMSKLPMVVQGKYIITSVRNGLMVTNIRRAKERILYERFLKAISRNEHLTQTTLFPVQMQVGVEQCLVFQEHQQLLESLGFDIAIFGSDTVVVNGVPEGYSAEPGKVQDMLYNLAAILSEDHSSLQLTMASTMADRFARVGASSCDGDLSPTQAKQLIDELFGCENSEYTISGRKIMVLLSVDELDKKF